MAKSATREAYGLALAEFGEKYDIVVLDADLSKTTKTEIFAKQFPNRFFDVGIAEEHAVTFCSGLAKNGMKPVFAVYSTFLQRCYDQIVHDVSLQKQKVVLAIDRAGFVGEDGETHHGLFDVAFLGTIPEIKIYSPYNFALLKEDMHKALYDENVAAAVRYPRGSENEITKKLMRNSPEYSTYGDIGADTAIVTYGRITSEAVVAVDSLKSEGKSVFLVAFNLIKPIPDDAIALLINKKKIYFFEEGQKSGGIAERLGCILLENGYSGKYSITAVEDKFVEQASVSDLLNKYGLDNEAMIKKISEEF